MTTAAAAWDQVGIRFEDGGSTVGPASIRLAPGERLLLLGPSGCGKSSLLLALTGLIPAAMPAQVTGRRRIAGQEAEARPAAAWADRVAHVFQAPERNLCGMRVEEEVAFALEQQGRAEASIRARVAWALGAVGLDPGMAGRPVSTLSGGEKQRVSLAATLAQGGDVLLIDEPTAHLDPAATARIHALLKRPSRAATLIVDHRLDGLIDAVDRVVVLCDRGTVLAEGPPRPFFRKHGPRLRALGVWTPAGAELDAELCRSGIRLPTPPLGVGEALAALTPARDALAAVERFCAARTSRRGGSPGPAAVRLTGASCRVPGGPAVVQDVTLDLHRGEVLALVGPNGAGKTTLGLALAGLTPLADGRREGAPGAVALQNPDLQFVAGSVADEVRASLPACRRPRLDVDGVLGRWGLAGLGARHPLALSEGQKRRLALACLDLVPGLETIVLDEPTAGLDRTAAETLERRVQALADEGRAVVLITHDMDLAWRLADRVAVVDGGRVAALAPADAVFADRSGLSAHGLAEPAAATARRWLEAGTRGLAC